MALTVTVAGTDRTKHMLRDGSFTYDRRFTSTGLLTAKFRDRRRGVSTWRPAIDDTIVIADGATTHFSGIIVDVRDAPVFNPGYGSVTTITARDQMRFPDQRIVSQESFASGQTLKQVLTSLNTEYLATFGVTVDAGMASGPTMDALAFDNTTLSQVFRYLMDVTGYVIYINPSNVLKAFSPGSVSCSFSLTEANGNARGALNWQQTRRKYVNTVYLIAGPQQQIEKTDTFTGNGGTSTWTLTYTPAPNPETGFILCRGYVTEAGTFATLSQPGGGGMYTFDPSTNVLTRAAGAAGVGVSIEIIYVVQFPITVSSTDAGEVASHGPYEDIVRDEQITDMAAAQAAADGYLARYKTTPQEIVVETRQSGADLGQAITLTFANRGVSSSALITGITTYFLQGTQTLKYRLTCLDGTQAQASWVDYFRGVISGSASGSAGELSGGVYPGAAGIFSNDVIANSGLTDALSFPQEVGLRSSIGAPSNSATFGPGVTIGRADQDWSWGIVANELHVSGGSGRRQLVFLRRNLGSPDLSLLALSTDDSNTAGTYYLYPPVGSGATVHLGTPSGPVSDAARFGALYLSSGMYERGRTIAAGEWTTYTPTLGQTGGTSWTVGAGSVVASSMLIGETCWVQFEATGTTIAGTPTSLNFSLPQTSVATVDRPMPHLIGGVWANDALVNVSGALVTIYRFPTPATTTYPAGSYTIRLLLEFPI